MVETSPPPSPEGLEHERIWLQPKCCSEEWLGRNWCEECEDGIQPTEYVRADLYTSLEAKVGDLESALEPLALLAGDVNMNDPLSKWLTIAQLHAAKDALTKATEQSV